MPFPKARWRTMSPFASESLAALCADAALGMERAPADGFAAGRLKLPVTAL